MKVLKIFLLLFLVLLPVAAMQVFSDEGGEPPPASIDQQLSDATTLRNVGRGLTITGIACSAVAGVAVLGTLLSVADFILTGDSYWEEDAEKSEKVLAISGISALISLGFGIPLWIVGARRLRNANEQYLSFQIEAPNPVRGKGLGGISILFRY